MKKDMELDRPAGRVLRPVDFVFAIGLAVALAVVFPWGGVTPMDDDWDFLSDLLGLPFSEAVLRTANGQFIPVHKALYGAVLLAANYSLVATAFLQSLVTAMLLISGRWLLKEAGSWSAASAGLLLTVAFNGAAIRGVLRWPWEANVELSLLAYLVAVVAIVRSSRGTNVKWLWLAGTAIGCSIFTFGTGLGACAALPVVLVGVRWLRPDAVRLRTTWLVSFCTLGWVLLWLATGAGVGSAAAVREAAWWLERGYFAPDPTQKAYQVASYGLYLTLANAAPAGLAIGATSGLANGILALALFGGALWVVARSKDRARALAIAALLASHLAVNLSIALVRWPYGLAHSGSFRYVFHNVFFQLLILGLCLAEADARTSSVAARAVRTSVWILVVAGGIWGGSQSLVRARLEERARAECLQGIEGGRRDMSCLAGISGYQTPQRVREIWLTLQRGS